MSSFPTPLRAALGLALTVVDTARDTATHLPQKAAGLPVAVASQAVQLSLRAQQQYAAYVNKGDELIGTFRGAPAEPPAWATFDEDEPTPARNTAFDRVPDAEDDLDDVLDDVAPVADLAPLDTLTALDDLAPPADADDLDELDPIAALDALDELQDLTDELAADVGGPSESRLDVALDALDGSYEHADGPRPTPGAPDTVTSEASVEIGPDGDEVIGADAPRSTAPREPRKATRKIATKSSRKVAAKKAPPAKKAPGKKAAKKVAAPLAETTLEGAPLDIAAPPAKKAAKKAAAKAPATAARKAAKKAPGKKAAKKIAPPADTIPFVDPTPPTDDTPPIAPPADGSEV